MKITKKNTVRPICIVLGTRPEIIKMAPVIKECIRTRKAFYIIHSGQHYSREMDAIFFENLGLPQPLYNLEVGSGSHVAVISSIMQGMEKVFTQSRPRIVLVQGDTNTVLAGAMTAHKMNIPVGHIEAGLRSFDLTMPEESNRIMVDHISDYLFAPTILSSKNLIREHITPQKIHIVGNTIVEAVKQFLPPTSKQKRILNSYGVSSKRFSIVTLHRPHNVDDPERLQNILSAIGNSDTSEEILFLAHPRTKKQIVEHGITLPSHLRMQEPIGYFDMLTLEANSSLIFTDSGGLQEEACILGVPCITIRPNTERPETILLHSNMLAEPSHESLTHAIRIMSKARTWKHPFGDGNTSRQILACIEHLQ